MSKRKLNYRFHDPNPVEVTADYILEILIEANKEKVEKILQEEIDQEEKALKENRLNECWEISKNMKKKIEEMQ